jgi:hypothetical protein
LHLQHLRREELAGRDASLALSIPTTGNTQEANLTGYLSRKLEDLFITQLSLALQKTSSTKRRTAKKVYGGSITATENIIPNGVLHEEFNKLGDKGMPVVKCKK